MAPTTRTEAGYRVYDGQVLGRLAFIARAKQLGCSLDEITDLVDVWDGERCGPVQRQFHELVTDKLHATQTRIAELTAFASQLQTAAAQLNEPALDGPCGDGCACLAVPLAQGWEYTPAPCSSRAITSHGSSTCSTGDG